jgi:hypothetical protein
MTVTTRRKRYHAGRWYCQEINRHATFTEISTGVHAGLVIFDGPAHYSYATRRRPEPCIHAGVFATDRPTEFCGSCRRDVPRCEL